MRAFNCMRRLWLPSSSWGCYLHTFSVRLSVRLPVCLSVCLLVCVWLWASISLAFLCQIESISWTSSCTIAVSCVCKFHQLINCHWRISKCSGSKDVRLRVSVCVCVRMLSARRLMSFSVDVVFISSSWLLFSFFFPFFISVWFFFGFFWRFNFLMISQIAYFLHDAGCQQLHPCLCHFLCVCICVWVCGCHLTHRTVTEITMIIMKFFSVVEGFFLLWDEVGWIRFLQLML